MFSKAAAFNGDISRWDVSSVENMYVMFWEAISAKSFTQQLCAHAWVNSTAIRTDMFQGSSAWIAPTSCAPPNESVAGVAETTLANLNMKHICQFPIESSEPTY